MKRLSSANLEEALTALAAFLEESDSPRETLVIIGGSALISLGLISRATKDVDIMAGVDAERGLVDPRPMSEALRIAAAKVAREMQLDPHWLNTGPADQVLAGLPEGFLSRLTRRDYGPALTLCFPDRFDFIHLKLFAIMDQGPGRHTADLTALKPTDDELLTAARWVLTQDAGEVFPQIVRNALTDLGYGYVAAQL
ncbi:MAG: DUF6036 family nucleotidyltransferase [Prosthecobacter sp.]|nr:DUF6036 family nucleotidyltransferase [Prosthecobacter sp.]